MMSMKIDSLAALKSSFASKNFFTYLILSANSYEREQAVALFKEGNVHCFNKENFSSQDFLNEVETMGMFSREATLIVEEIELFDAKQIELFTEIASHLRQGVTLVFVGSTLSAQSRLFKTVEKLGLCLKYKEQKRWEREKEEAAELCSIAKKAGVILSTEVAMHWVKSLSGHEEMKQREFEKVICYLGGKGTITKELLETLCAPAQEVPVWILSDAIFARDLKQASRLCKGMLVETGSLFPLLSYMRSQFDLGIRLMQAYVSGGREKARLVAPQLKGALLDKKIQMFMNYGAHRLRGGLTLMLRSELRAKSETVDPSLLFEILIAKLCL